MTGPPPLHVSIGESFVVGGKGKEAKVAIQIPEDVSGSEAVSGR